MYRLSKTNDEKTGLALLLMLTRFLPLHYAERHGNERSAFTEAEATMPRYGITDIDPAFLWKGCSMPEAS